jgi:ketosteroid isomerase-like protein
MKGRPPCGTAGGNSGQALRPMAGFAMLILVCTSAWCGTSECSATLSAEDATQVRSVIESYRTSWLRGNAKGVLDTLAPDAVLLPAHGGSPVVGTAAITKYWWPPEALLTKITTLEITIDSLGGDCQVAYVHGHDDVRWTVTENGVTKTYGHPGTYLNVLKKLPNGSWRISYHMWDDATP